MRNNDIKQNIVHQILKLQNTIGDKKYSKNFLKSCTDEKLHEILELMADKLIETHKCI